MENITINTRSTELVRLDNKWRENDSERFTITFNRNAIVSLIYGLEESVSHHGWSAAEAKLILKLEEIINS